MVKVVTPVNLKLIFFSRARVTPQESAWQRDLSTVNKEARIFFRVLIIQHGAVVSFLTANGIITTTLNLCHPTEHVV